MQKNHNNISLFFIFYYLSTFFLIQSTALAQTPPIPIPNKEEKIVIYLPRARGYYNDFTVTKELHAPVFYDNSKVKDESGSWVDPPNIPSSTSWQLNPDGYSSRLNKITIMSAFTMQLLWNHHPNSSDKKYTLDPANTTLLRNLEIRKNLIMNAPNPKSNGNPKWIHQNNNMADIAEGMNTIGPVEKTDVVCIDQHTSNRLIKSSKAYDTNVAGIISSSPAIYLCNADKKQPLALCGRVLCKVVNENGNISAGDLLVTSSIPGHAMKPDQSKIIPGTIIGKALEPCNEKEGIILVLVNSR